MIPCVHPSCHRAEWSHDLGNDYLLKIIKDGGASGDKSQLMPA